MIYDDVATLRSRTISLILISCANSFIHSWSVGIVTLSVKTSNKWWWCNQSNNIYMITRKYHPLHHHRQKQSLKAIQFHTCWSIPDELAYLKFSRIFSKTFGWNIKQELVVAISRENDVDESVIPKNAQIFKTSPMFCPNKDVDLPPSWSDAPKHRPTHALDKKPSAARREKSILMFINIVIISFKSGLKDICTSYIICIMYIDTLYNM